MFTFLPAIVLPLLLFADRAACASWTSAPFGPPSIPLAVRSPYLSAWLTQGKGTALNAAWPTFWTGSILGWARFVNVDGTSYNFLGTPGVPAQFQKAVQKSFQFTSTQSIFVMTAGPVDLTVTFLSPIEPNNLVNQSIPFSYFALSAVPNDNSSHSVQFYTDISAEWVTSNDSLTVNWTTTIDHAIVHQVQLEEQTTFTEVSDRIQQGSAFYATLNATSTTYQTGQDIAVRAQFINHSSLLNTQDTDFRAVSDDWPVFAFAHDLGEISGPSETIVFAVGHVRDPAIEYIVANDGRQSRSSYFWSQYASTTEMITTFLLDFIGALTRAMTLDDQIRTNATAVSSNYAGLVALSLRQAYGALEITVSQDSAGQFNTSDIMVFLKEISSGGNVNTVDVIAPTWPALLYTNPTIGKYVLLPLLEYQTTGQYPNAWAVHDMGAHYPQALGHNDGQDEKMPVEECGNMLIMLLSYVQRTNDTSIISSYYSLLEKWTDYLIVNSLTPAEQLDTDDFQNPLANATNLAIKGIIGIKAMSEMAAMVGDSANSANYSSIAASYVQQWQKLATASDGLHLTLVYGNESTWGLTYNMFADKLLNTNIIPSSVYDMETSFYGTISNMYGVPLDIRNAYTLSVWEIWAAAFAATTAVRDMFINGVVSYITDGMNSLPLGDWYTTTGGQVNNNFKARPVVGAHFALLVLPSQTSNSTNSTNGSGSTNGGGSGTGSGSDSGGNQTSHKSSGCRLVSGWLGITLCAVVPLVFMDVFA